MKLETQIYLLFFCFTFISSKTTIHILPHSHDDPGWIKTFDEYFNLSIIPILDNTIQSLMEKPNRTFIYSEISFFKKWYDLQPEAIKQNVKTLVKEKRFEFVNGGFVMEDEAVGHYTDAITELRIGMEFLKNEFNITPHIGWFLDEFGHTASHGHIYSEFGYDKAVFGRFHKSDKSNLYSTGDLEFNWKPLGKGKEIFTHVVFDYYCPPKPISTFSEDKEIFFNNDKLKNYADSWIQFIKNELKGYKHEHYILFFGCDFTFVKKDINFNNIEKLVEYMKENYSDEVEIIYSTAENYFDCVERELKVNNKEIKVISGDFVPYVDWDNHFWTGFYTSRPYIKGRIRESSVLLSVSSKLATEYLLSKRISNPHDYYNHQIKLLEVISLTQHHDAITGTAKSYVNDDYLKMLEEGDEIVKGKMKEIIKELFNEDMKVCLSNGKVSLGCNFNIEKDTQNMTFSIYNPLIEGKILITLELSINNEEISFDLLDGYNSKIEYDKYCIKDFKCYIYFFYELSKSYSFLSFKMSNITINNNNTSLNLNTVQLSSLNDTLQIEYDDEIVYNASYSPSENIFQVIYKGGNEYTFNITTGFYIGINDGAYLFNAPGKIPTNFNINTNESFYIKGVMSSSFILNSTNTTLLITIFKKPFFIHVITLLFPVSKPVKKNGDIILSINTNIDNIEEDSDVDIFYTDTSGMIMQKREISKKLRTGESFYPISKSISIKDKDKRITIYNDRPQGGTSIKKGSVFLMINRWSVNDDNKGLNEKLYEQQSTEVKFTAKHIIVLDSGKENYDTKIRNLVDSYFTNIPLVFYKESNIQNAKKFNIFNMLSHTFFYSENIRMEILYVSNVRVIVQFFNAYDEFFGENGKNEISVLINKKYNLSICRSNGQNCERVNSAKEGMFKNLRNSFYRNILKYDIEPLEFKVFELTFN